MKTKPYKHQLKEFEKYKDHRARAMLWGMRTGKTKASIDKACYLYENGKIEGLLIFAPNGVHTKWVKLEIAKHCWDSSNAKALAWTAREGQQVKWGREFEALLKHKGLKIFALNVDAISFERPQAAIKKFLKACGKDRAGRFKVKAVVDESHHFRTPGSRRTAHMRRLAPFCAYREILSGTSVLNSPLHAFAQFELLVKGALGFITHKAFKANFAVFGQRFERGHFREYVVNYKNLKVLKKRMALWSSVVLREEVDDMPDLVFETRYVEPNAEQLKVYKTVAEELYAEVGGENISIKDAGVKGLKLQQVLSGFIKNEDGEIVSICDDPPRLQALRGEIERNLPGQCIVWCHFTEDIRRVKEMLDSLYIKSVEYHGKISQSKREANYFSFCNDPSVKVFIGQPAAGGEGLNLSVADTVIIYSRWHNTIIRAQAVERGTMVGGNTVNVVDIVSPDTSDEVILLGAHDKAKTADALAGAGLRDLLELV